MKIKYLDEDIRKELLTRPVALKGVIACIENEISAADFAKNEELLKMYCCGKTAVLVNRDLIDEVVTMLLGEF